ncbi:MAG: nitroreductase family protein [Betaproteobacteria bacterium]
MEAILSRRSIRKYTAEPVPDEVIQELLKAAMAAPSAGNEQPWHFIVIRDRRILDEIPRFHPYSQMLREAPVAILVCGGPRLQKYQGYWPLDCAAATENVLIAIQALGLGGVWLGVYPVEDRMNALRHLLGIPSEVVPFSLIPVGYPAETKPPAERFDPRRVHRDRW